MTVRNRVIPCLDVADGRVVKGVNFVDLKDAGDPVEQAKAYDEAGADELCFLDITASHEKRGTILDIVSRTAERWLHRVLTADVPVVLDADALRIMADSDDIAGQVRSRTERGALTVLAAALIVIALGGLFLALNDDHAAHDKDGIEC